ncbi:cupin domain-containing protein [Deinococcus arcticus]|nr:cupin domain-containing protein [Deinococcus arcticus]
MNDVFKVDDVQVLFKTWCSVGYLEEIGAHCTGTMHAHQQTDQFFFVAEGHVAVTINGTCTSLCSGQGILIPAGAPHKLDNLADTPSTLLCVNTKAARISTTGTDEKQPPGSVTARTS